jgi:hypothetical protein
VLQPKLKQAYGAYCRHNAKYICWLTETEARNRKCFLEHWMQCTRSVCWHLNNFCHGTYNHVWAANPLLICRSVEPSLRSARHQDWRPKWSSRAVLTPSSTKWAAALPTTPFRLPLPPSHWALEPGVLEKANETAIDCKRTQEAGFEDLATATVILGAEN